MPLAVGCSQTLGPRKTIGQPRSPDSHSIPAMDQGQIVEQNSPAEFFDNPQHERTKLFLSQILH